MKTDQSGRNGYVQRFERARHRDRDTFVDQIPDFLGQASRLVSENEYFAMARLPREQRCPGRGIETQARESRRLECGQTDRQAVTANDRTIVNRTRRRANDESVDPGLTG